MSLARSGISLLFGLAALAAAAGASADPPPPAAAVSEPPKLSEDPDPVRRLQAAREAMVLHDEASTLYEQGRYRAAIERLEAALVLDPKGRELVYNLALIHEKLADLEDADRYYRRYLEMEPDPKIRLRVNVVLRRLEGAEKEAAARARDNGPRSPPPPPAPPRRVRPWVVATASVGGVAFVMGSVFGLNALARNPGENAHTGGGVTIADLQADAHVAHTDAVISDVSFLMTVAAAGTAAFLYFSTPRSASTAPLSTGAPASPAPAVSSVALGPGRLRVSF